MKYRLHISALAIFSVFSVGMGGPGRGAPSPDLDRATIGQREPARIIIAQQAPPEPLPEPDVIIEQEPAPPEPEREPDGPPPAPDIGRAQPGQRTEPSGRPGEDARLPPEPPPGASEGEPEPSAPEQPAPDEPRSEPPQGESRPKDPSPLE